MNDNSRWRFWGKTLAAWILCSGCVLGIGAVGAANNPGGGSEPGILYNWTNVWQIHLKFSADQWEALEPKGGGFGPFGGGPGRGGGGGGGFGPGMFLGPAMFEQANADGDGTVSQKEFADLGDRWFTKWDTNRSGRLNADQLQAGLGNAFGPPPGGGGAGGPGRGGGPGLFLQGGEGKRNGLSAATGVEFADVKAELEFNGRRYPDVAVRYKGNGTFMQSRGSLKRSFKIDLNDFAKGRKISGAAKLNLHNCVTDASFMNEVMSHRLYRDAGVPAPRTAYARVYVTVPGLHDRRYFGLYSLVENPDANFAAVALGTRKGALLKPVTRSPFEYLGDDWQRYQQTYDPKTELTAAQKARVIEFCKLVSQSDDAEFARRLGDYVDLDQFARFMSVTVWLSTLDSILSIGQNYLVHLHPQTQKFQFMPWDLDHSFGQFFLMGTPEQREMLSIHKPWQGENRLLERVFKVDAFKKVYLAKLQEFSETIFKPERFVQQVDELARALRPAVQEESEERLARFDKAVAGEPVEPAGFGGGPGRGPGGGGGGFGPPFGFMQPAKPIKGFVSARATSVQDQLAGRSEGKTLEFGGPGGPGGPGWRGGRGGPGGPGGPGRFGPGLALSGPFLRELDADKDGAVTQAEFRDKFNTWFKAWNTDGTGRLTLDQLRSGVDRNLSPFPPGGGPPGGGPPGGGPVVVPLGERPAN